MNRTLGWILLAASMGASGAVLAQGPTDGSSSTRASKLGAERQRLRTELDRLNAEIDALKREHRGIRDDYRLRSRMADAEALARRLTEIDARTPGTPSSAFAERGPSTPFPSAPEAKPSDDRAILEAKADILADQARHLTAQADTLAAHVTDLRGRNELRRRAGQLEHDPFSPFEQAKRRLIPAGSTLAAGSVASFGANPAATSKGAGPSAAEGNRADTASGAAPTASGAATPGAPPPASMAPTGSVVVPGGGTGTPGGATAPVTAPSVAAPSGAAPGSATLGGAASVAGGSPAPLPQAPAISAVAGSVSKAQPSLLPPPTPDNPGSVAIQFQGILDASTLAQIRRLESSGSRSGNLAAMEWALSALRARANQLSTNAAVLRNSAKAAR
jgi:outer membrane murein-binding lipoprotein Lpp